MSEATDEGTGEGQAGPRQRDKTMTEDEVVARLESGMTVGIGGWGSRRKAHVVGAGHSCAATSTTSPS